MATLVGDRLFRSSGSLTLKVFFEQSSVTSNSQTSFANPKQLPGITVPGNRSDVTADNDGTLNLTTTTRRKQKKEYQVMTLLSNNERITGSSV